MLMTHNVQDLFVFQKLKMRNDTFCFMPYFQLYETIVATTHFISVAHSFSLRVFAILSNTLLLNVDMSIKKNLASTVVLSLIMIHFGGKCFQNTFKFKYPSTQLTSSVQVILR